MIKNQMSRTSYFKRQQKRQKNILQLNIAKNKACYFGGFIAMLKIKCYN
nr:MAG TPA: hypothetical protein [Caudoviricetes sp.]